MLDIEKISSEIFNIKNEKEFNNIALEIFKYQYLHNEIYQAFIKHLSINNEDIDHYTKIPFLPIEFFKMQNVVCFPKEHAEKVFISSGTTGENTSKHFVKYMELYEKSFLGAFNYFFGDPSTYTILALLPSYLEREGSSLIYMVEKLIHLSQKEESGFYLYNHNDLIQKLKDLSSQKRKIILFGVTFALLDVVERNKLDINDLIIVETGGMKGRRKEIIRIELHQQLQEGYGTGKIYSEYGMTELLSQAYSLRNGKFSCPPWMKVIVRDTNDPLQIINTNTTGGINIIDLANIYSCSFIATQDLGKLHENGQFEVLGRFDHSDVRGCNLLVS